MSNFWAIITKHRVITILVLLLILAGLCSYYYDNFTNYQDNPGTGSIVKNYPEGEMVGVAGSVTETFQGGFYMEENYENRVVTYKVLTTVDIKPGDKAQVLGTMGPEYTVTAEKLKITEKWSYQFLFLRSFIALIFLIFIFNRYWKFNWKEKVFIRKNPR